MSRAASSFWRDDTGQGLAEYCTIIALVAVVLVGVIPPSRVALLTAFTTVTAALTTAA